MISLLACHKVIYLSVSGGGRGQRQREKDKKMRIDERRHARHHISPPCKNQWRRVHSFVLAFFETHIHVTRERC